MALIPAQEDDDDIADVEVQIDDDDLAPRASTHPSAPGDQEDFDRRYPDFDPMARYESF